MKILIRWIPISLQFVPKHFIDLKSSMVQGITWHCTYDKLNVLKSVTLMRCNTFPMAHFYPRPVLAFRYCRCLRLSVSPSVTKFVRAITHYPFKLGSPNLDQRYKRPLLRSLMFCGTIDRDLQGQIELKSQNLPLFELVHAITHHQLKLQFLNLEQKCILTLFRSLPILGLIEIDLQFNF